MNGPKTIVLLATCALCWPALEAGADELELPLAFEAPTHGSAPLGDLLQVPGAALHAAPGQPLLPERAFRLAVPPGHRVVGVRLTQVRTEIVPGTYGIAPAQPPVPLSARVTPAPVAPDPNIYNSDEAFPASWSEPAGLQFSRGYAVAGVIVHPLRYRPLSGVVERLVSAKLVVTTAPGGPVSPLLRGQPRDLQALAKRLDQADALAAYPERAPIARGGRLDPGSYAYLIVTPEQFSGLGGADSLEALADHRAANGLPAAIVTLEWIQANYTGTRPDGGQDDATRIRDFLTEAYAEWGTEYVLLVGDADGADNGGESGDDLLQVRKFWVEGLQTSDGPLADYVPSDLYYACLDGTFDYDADGLYGELMDGPAGEPIDLLAELAVGRAPADSAAEVRNFVAKTLAYEAAAGTWLQDVLMVGEWLFEGPVWGGDYMDDIIHGSTMGGVTTLGFDSLPFFACETLYDRDLGSAEAWGAAELVPLLDAGPHIVNHLGHSNTIYNMRLQNPQVDALTNQHPFFHYSQGCYNGAFDNQIDESGYIYSQDSIAEHLVLGDHGAFATVSNSRYGWGGGGRDGVSQRFHREFWDAIFGEGKTTLGEALNDSKQDNAWAFSDPYFRWVGYESNLLGDPAVRLKKNLGTDNPLIGTYPPSVELFTRAGDVELLQAGLTVANDGVGVLAWTAASDQPWLSVTPAAGGDGDGVQIEVDPSGLAAGEHLGTITFTSDQADNSPLAYPVRLTVIEPERMPVPHEDAGPAPVIDGSLADGEWDLALPRPIDADGTGQVTLYSMVVGDVLYLAVDDRIDESGNSSDQMRLYFDKDLDGAWPPDEASSDEGEYLLLNGTTYWWLLFNDGGGLSGPDQPTSSPDHVEMDLGVQDGHRVYEMSLDLNQSMLDVGPLGTFGMLFWVADLATGSRDYTGSFPVDMPRLSETQFAVDDQRFFGVVELDPEGAVLQATPRGLSVEATMGRGAVDPIAVAIVEPGGASVDFAASADQDWLSVSPASGTTPGEIVVSVDHADLELGEYHGVVELTSAGAWNTPYRIPVDLRVAPTPARIQVEPAAFSLVAAKGGPNPRVLFTLTNTGGQALQFSCTHADGWLEAAPAAAILAPGDSRQIDLVVDLDALEEGVHQGELLVSDPLAEGSPAAVQVEVEVLPEQDVPPVTDLAVERMSEALRLTWRQPDSPLVTRVIVRRDPDVAPAAPHLGTGVFDGLGEELLDEGLTDGQRYCYAAFTQDQAGRSSAPVTACGVPGENRPPPVPTHLSPRDGSTLSVAPELVAAPVVDPDFDEVTYTFRLLSPQGEVLSEDAGAVADGRVSLALADLQPAQGYTWQVQAVDAAGAASGWSDAWTFNLRAPSTDGGSDGGEEPCDTCGQGGCGCATRQPAPAGLIWLGLFGLAGWLRRRRS